MERDSRGVGFEEYGGFETEQGRCRDEWGERMGSDDLAAKGRFGQSYITVGTGYFVRNFQVFKLKMPIVERDGAALWVY